jgi:hypothetical protein
MKGSVAAGRRDHDRTVISRAEYLGGPAIEPGEDQTYVGSPTPAFWLSASGSPTSSSARSKVELGRRLEMHRASVYRALAAS